MSTAQTCSRCDGTGKPDHAGYGMDACDHGDAEARRLTMARAIDPDIWKHIDDPQWFMPDNPNDIAMRDASLARADRALASLASQPAAAPASSGLQEWLLQAVDGERLAVEAARDGILKSLRDRRLLKYLFEEEPDNVGAYGYVEAPIEIEVQLECAEDLARIAIAEWIKRAPSAPATSGSAVA